VEWTAESFIDRMLRRPTSDWWAGHQSEPSLERNVAKELSGDFRKRHTQLFFFSNSENSSIDGRVGPVGVELKYTDLGFGGIIDGAIHRGVAWVLGNPHQISSPEAVSLHVVNKKSRAIASELCVAVAPVLGSLAALGIHIVYVKGDSGEHWRALEPSAPTAMPPWLATKTVPVACSLPTTDAEAVRQLDFLDSKVGRDRYLYGHTLRHREYRGDHGEKLARAERSDQWQMIDVGMLLRGSGYDAVKIVYRNNGLAAAGRGVERRVQTELRQRFGVVLDWGVPV